MGVPEPVPVASVVEVVRVVVGCVVLTVVIVRGPLDVDDDVRVLVDPMVMLVVALSVVPPG